MRFVVERDIPRGTYRPGSYGRAIKDELLAMLTEERAQELRRYRKRQRSDRYH